MTLDERQSFAHPGANSAAPQLRQSALASSSLRMRSGVFSFPQRFDLRDALVAAKLVFVRLLATDLGNHRHASVVGADLIVGRQCPTVDPQ